MTDQHEFQFNSPRGRKPKKPTELPPKSPPPPLSWPKRLWRAIATTLLWPAIAYSKRVLEKAAVEVTTAAIIAIGGLAVGMGYLRPELLPRRPSIDAPKPQQEPIKERDPWEPRIERSPS